MSVERRGEPYVYVTCDDLKERCRIVVVVVLHGTRVQSGRECTKHDKRATTIQHVLLLRQLRHSLSTPYTPRPSGPRPCSRDCNVDEWRRQTYR